MAHIETSNGFFALVSDEDFERLSKYRWFARRNAGQSGHYAMRREGSASVYMHREVLLAPKGLTVDHINRDGLDNRRENLRLATRIEQSRNQSTKKSIFPELMGLRGIARVSQSRWQAQIMHHGKRYIGRHRASLFQAAFDFDALAVKHHGEFASLNFPCRRGRELTVAAHEPRRWARGGQVNTAKLSEDDVRAIRASSETQRALARQYGVNQTIISDVKRRATWRHVV